MFACMEYLIITTKKENKNTTEGITLPAVSSVCQLVFNFRLYGKMPNRHSREYITLRINIFPSTYSLFSFFFFSWYTKQRKTILIMRTRTCFRYKNTCPSVERLGDWHWLLFHLWVWNHAVSQLHSQPLRGARSKYFSNIDERGPSCCASMIYSHYFDQL